MPAVAFADLIPAGSERSILYIREGDGFRSNLVLASGSSVSTDVDVALVLPALPWDYARIGQALVIKDLHRSAERHDPDQPGSERHGRVGYQSPAHVSFSPPRLRAPSSPASPPSSTRRRTIPRRSPPRPPPSPDPRRTSGSFPQAPTRAASTARSIRRTSRSPTSAPRPRPSR